MGSYVVGIGVISAIGNNAEENFDALVSKRSGIGPLTHFSTSLEVPVGQVDMANGELQSLLGLPVGRTYSRTALLGMVAVKEALCDAGIEPRSGLRIGLVSSTSAGGMDLSENFYMAMGANGNGGRLRDVVSHDCGDSTEQIASALGINGFLSTISTACSSSANALMLADRLLNHDQLDVVVAGGIDPLCKFTINGFNSLMILDKELCRPFDNTRAGLNLGEAAGFVVLQRNKPASGKCYCRLSGYANANDAYHQTATSPDGDGPFLAMSGALRKAGLQPADVDYVNVHGTGTGNNDLSEGRAMQRLFGEAMPRFSSTKIYTGHTLGAAGGIEAVYSALTLSRDVIFPTFNFKNPMEELAMKPETEVIRNAGVKVVMSNSFGFGGNVSSLVFSAE